ncbi:hypothetical protein J6590_027004 [Homalodisca vitripennis]|nr:hypothetical protein J6590_027004 [Homalodisca vitripennis]
MFKVLYDRIFSPVAASTLWERAAAGEVGSVARRRRGYSDNVLRKPPPKKAIFRGGETLFCVSIALFVSLSSPHPAAPPPTPHHTLSSSPSCLPLVQLSWFLPAGRRRFRLRSLDVTRPHR